MDALANEDMLGDRLHQRHQRSRTGADPEVDALPMERQVRPVLAEQDLRAEFSL